MLLNHSGVTEERGAVVLRIRFVEGNKERKLRTTLTARRDFILPSKGAGQFG